MLSALSGPMPPPARERVRTVVLAHAWVANGRDDAERAQSARRQASDSERDIAVGGIGYVPSALFDGFGYAALGHLHGRQTLAGHLRYSGSPLPYSFSERDQCQGQLACRDQAPGEGRAPSGCPPRSTGGSPCWPAASTTC